MRSIAGWNDEDIQLLVTVTDFRRGGVVVQTLQRDTAPDDGRKDGAQTVAVDEAIHHPAFSAFESQAAQRTNAIALQQFDQSVAPSKHSLPRKQFGFGW